MTIIERVKQLQLPLDEVVVIGSGLLDALQLRPARDVDLVVSERLFKQLAQQPEYQSQQRGTEVYLTRGTCEIWRDWGPALPFTTLQASATTIAGVLFVNQAILVAWKKQRGLPKDQRDVSLLEGRDIWKSK